MIMLQIDVDDIWEAENLSLELYGDSSDELFAEIGNCGGDLEEGLSHVDGDVEPDSIFFGLKEMFCENNLVKEIQEFSTVEALAAFILGALANNQIFKFMAKNVKQGFAIILAIYILKEGIDKICSD
ncbi:MAG: hypothetical protein F6J94_24455 [Moorea sp. SIO1F2]|uniref:hypothetical protein n=1 Tax=Moorena sp. SIO1F2 TaxID=2607819 RepID=UPI0013B7B70D|nr:hypothetical protein [Moorena sp. SIO1F2]NET84951.1 hypothetical protein [Moorena sp. SIO1F2]